MDVDNQTIARDAVLDVPLNAVDLDGNPIAITVTGLPRFGALVDHGDGTASIRFTPSVGDRGDYAVTVVATTAMAAAQRPLSRIN